MLRKATDVLNQSVWRRAGAVAVTIAALLAVAAVPTGILRSTVIHFLNLTMGDVPADITATAPLLVCVLYWVVFLIALGASLYMAFLDIRYIRLQYALEKQRLFQQSLGEDLSSALSANESED